MALFRGRSHEASRLPTNIVEIMESFGRFEFDPAGSGLDSNYVWTSIVGPLLPTATADSASFLRELADAVTPVGGWAVYGGSHLVKELLGGDLNDDSYHAMMSASLDFLRGLGVPAMRLNGYESRFWREHKGRTEPWLRGRSRPTNPSLTDFAPGEVRRVAQLESRPDSNVIYVRRDADGRFTALVDARCSDDEPRRAQTVWKTMATLYELYCEIAESLQVPTFWAHPELKPFFPLPAPRIKWLPS